MTFTAGCWTSACIPVFRTAGSCIAYNDASFDLTVARFELRDDRAESLSVIYESDEFSIGSRIEWQDASHFFLSFGVGGDPYSAPGPQDLNADVGKIHRLTADGQIPQNNPILPGALTPSTIWSYGHRNPQGLHYDASERPLYATEHGPPGGDEQNIVVAGGNYCTYSSAVTARSARIVIRCYSSIGKEP